MHKYKNETGQNVAISGVGDIAPEQEFVTELVVEGPGLVYLGEVDPTPESQANGINGETGVQENAVTEAQKVAEENPSDGRA
jgi:hypothetical protein